ncbi:MAG: phospholipase, partial [Acidobacteria bacterium]|nr:phospholipase [Acidobacteriota bacterium]
MKTKGSRELFAITIIAILLLLYAAYSRKSSEAATIVNPIAENPEWIELTKQFAKAEFKNSTGSFRYRFFSPKSDEGKTYPLIIYLHGEEERGDDNEKQIATQRGGTVFARPQWQEKHPCFIFAPQCPVAADWQDERMVQLIAAALDELPQKYPIDFSRVYITGISMGGSGTWNLINKHPRFFAAAMPICGAYTVDSFKSVKKVPVWAFHAADDPIVPVGSPLVVKDTPQVESVFGTRKLMAALRSAGNLDTRYTEYAAGVMQEKYGVEPHNVWEAAYQDEAAIEWLFSHDLHNMVEINYIMPGVWNIDDTSYDSSFYIVEGRDKALVIDTGVSDIDLFQTAKSLTHLPFELAITHAHGDHLKLDNIKKFDKFYMSLKDKDLYENLKKTKYPESKFTANSIIDVKQGDRIDLGGSIVIEAVNLGDGHSPG